MREEDVPFSVTLRRWEWDDILRSISCYVQMPQGDPDMAFDSNAEWAEELGHMVTRLQNAIGICAITRSCCATRKRSSARCRTSARCSTGIDSRSSEVLLRSATRRWIWRLLSRNDCSSWGGANRRGLESVLRENDAGLRATLSPALHSILPQYFGTLGSTSSDHARMPPVRFLSFANPALRSCSRARALRTPERQ